MKMTFMGVEVDLKKLRARARRTPVTPSKESLALVARTSPEMSDPEAYRVAQTMTLLEEAGAFANLDKTVEKMFAGAADSTPTKKSRKRLDVLTMSLKTEKKRKKA